MERKYRRGISNSRALLSIDPFSVWVFLSQYVRASVFVYMQLSSNVVAASRRQLCDACSSNRRTKGPTGTCKKTRTSLDVVVVVVKGIEVPTTECTTYVSQPPLPNLHAHDDPQRRRESDSLVDVVCGPKSTPRVRRGILVL